MTVPELDFYSTDNLVNLSKFYPAEIHVPHHQLRNFISTAYEDKIFFVHKFDIFVIDIPKLQRSLVATVPFEARCLAADHGWICVGGEPRGDCAFVRIGDGDAQYGQFGHDLVVDSLGKEIVNSMTIHQIPGKDASYPVETVVLISNNDKTVTVYSLSQQEVLCVLTHAVAMNYASMSPDRTVIAAVGDSNEVYFYQRCDAGAADNESSNRGTGYQAYSWKQFAVPRIPAGEGVYDDFSFAVAFSPSGKYCAVSAQGGVISVFHMDQLLRSASNTEAHNAIMCTFRSSRPSLWGCVRSLSFSPEPWDLLAWTEDHGTIGIADIRRSFIRRQCVSLDRDEAETVDIENVTSSEYSNMNVKERLKHQDLHRMRALRGHPPVGARLLDDPGSTPRRQMTANSEAADLDAQERSVLEALETTIDDVEHYSLRAYSINYTPSPNLTPSAAHTDQRPEYDVQLLNPGVQIQAPHIPRRRQSVVLSESTSNRYLSQPDSSRALMTASPAPMSDDYSTPPMSTNDLTPSAQTHSQPLPYNIPPSDPWHVIEAQLIADRATGRNRTDQAQRSTSSTQSSNLAQVEAAIYAERQMSTRLERQLADERRLSSLLRTELEARERLLVARQQELESERARQSQLSPTLERILQRQLQSEQDNGHRRSSEIEEEIHSNSQRVERLMTEREALRARALDNRDRPGTSIGSTQGSTLSQQLAEGGDLDLVLRRMEMERRAREQRIRDLEMQVRRAESRVEITAAQTGSESARDVTDNISDTRFLAASRPAHSAASLRRAQQMDQYGVPFGSRASLSGPSAYSNRLRAAAARRAEAGGSDIRSTLPRGSEMAGRVSENDMRLARTMLHAAVMDANGNWSAGQAVRRATGSNASSIHANIMEEILREGGVGTAGIGWSPDGSHLYSGSVIGIFDFQVNLRDRMQFPAMKMR